MDPAPGDSEIKPGPEPAKKTGWVIMGSLVFIAMIAALVFLPGLLARPPVAGNPPVTPSQAATAISTTLPATVPGTTAAPPRATTTRAMTLPTTLPVTTMEGVSTTPSGPPGFTVTITPAHATAGRGETVVYRMLIEPVNGFSGEIHMEVTASFLFLSQTQDLGYLEPPYPKTIEYPFQVPDSLPQGITINGVVRSAGDGITREDHLSLTVT